MARWSRSVLAVVSGVVAFATAFALGAWAVFILTGSMVDRHPDAGLGAGLATVAFGFIGVAVAAPIVGGFVTARLAPRSPMLHSVAATAIVVLIFAMLDRFHQGAADFWTLRIYWAIGLVAMAVGTKLGSRARTSS